MKLIIDTTEEDAKLLEGFARATNWREESRLTQVEWLHKKTAEWIAQKARGGSVINATAAPRTAYLSAVRVATDTAAVEIALPSKELPVASVTPSKTAIRE